MNAPSTGGKPKSKSLPDRVKSSYPAGKIWNIRNVIYIFIILVSVVSFWINGVQRAYIGRDFMSWYVMGQFWLEGRLPYGDPEYIQRIDAVSPDFEREADFSTDVFYPPISLSVYSLLARLPVETAHSIFSVFQLVFVVGGLFLLGILLNRYHPVGMAEIALLATFLNTGFARAGMRISQVSLFMLVFMVGAYLLDEYQKPILAGLSLAAMIFKYAFMPMFALHFVIKKRVRLILTTVLSVVLLVILPLAIVGAPIFSSLNQWFMVVISKTSAGVNDPSPDAPYSAFLQNLQPLVFRVVNSDAPWAYTLSYGLILIVVILVFGLIIKSPVKENNLLDFALVSNLTLLVVYHRLYDVFLLFPGILVLYLCGVKSQNRVQKTFFLISVIGIILVQTMPGSLIQNLAYNNPDLAGNYIFRLVAPFQAWSGVYLILILLSLKYLEVRETSSATSSGGKSFAYVARKGDEYEQPIRA